MRTLHTVMRHGGSIKCTAMLRSRNGFIFRLQNVVLILAPAPAPAPIL